MVPAPVFVNDPGPLTTPLNVVVTPPSASKVPPELPRTTEAPSPSSLVLTENRKAPPLMFTVLLVPSEALSETRNVPSSITVAPE